jgi:hypothetical protein
MPWTNPETFTAGQTLTAASMNIVSGNARMGGPVYTNEAARDAAITAPEEGMTAYLTASTVAAATGTTTAVPTGITAIYNGSAWVCVTPVSTRNDDILKTYTGSTAYGDLGGGTGVGPSVTLSTGTTALVSIATAAYSNGANRAFASVAVSGATTLAASDTWSAFMLGTNEVVVSRTFVLTGLTAGSNTFTMKYRNDAAAAITTYGFRTLTAVGIA